CSPQYFLDLLPAELGHRPRARAGVARVRRRRGAVDHALRDALQDRGDAEQVIGHVEIPVRGIDALAPGSLAIHLHILARGGDAELSEIKSADTAELPRRDVPATAVIGEIGERSAYSREHHV